MTKYQWVEYYVKRWWWILSGTRYREYKRTKELMKYIRPLVGDRYKDRPVVNEIDSMDEYYNKQWGLLNTEVSHRKRGSADVYEGICGGGMSKGQPDLEYEKDKENIE